MRQLRHLLCRPWWSQIGYEEADIHGANAEQLAGLLHMAHMMRAECAKAQLQEQQVLQGGAAGWLQARLRHDCMLG